MFLEPFEVVKDKPYHVKCSVKGEPSPEPRLSAYVSWNTRDSGTPYSHSERSVYSLKGEDYGAQYMPIGDDSTGEVSQPRGEDTQGLYLRRGDSEGEARRELLLTTHDSNASLTTGMFVYKPQLGDNRASVVCRAEQTDTSGERVLAESVRLATRRVDRLFVAPEILARRGPVAKQCYQTGTWELEVTGHPLPGVNDVHLIMLAQHSTERQVCFSN